MIRFARNQICICNYLYLLYAFNTAGPARGWPYSIATRIPPGPKIIKNAIFDDFENLQKTAFFDGFGPWD